MITFLRIVFSFILISMLCVTSWASLHCPLFGVPKIVYTHPWFIATLFDAYWGFITFTVWVFYKESNLYSKFGWLLAILSLGNIAISVYCLNQLYKIKTSNELSKLLSLKSINLDYIGISLGAVGTAVTVYAARH